jgi:hypothetical protein
MPQEIMRGGYGVNDGVSIAPVPSLHLQDQGPSSAETPTAHMPCPIGTFLIGYAVAAVSPFRC